MSAPFLVETYIDSTTSTTTSFVTTAALSVGSVLVLFHNRSTASTVINGVDNLVPAVGSVGEFRKLANSTRASTHDLSIVSVDVTNEIPANTTWTITQSGSQSRKAGVVAVWSDIVIPPIADATSGTEADDSVGSSNLGPNGSTSTASASTSSGTTKSTTYSFAAFTTGGTYTMTPEAGWQTLGQPKTIAGTSDRGVLALYREETATGIKTASGTYSTSPGWAAAITCLERTSAPVATAQFKEFVGGVWVALTAKEYNGNAWVPVSPKDASAM